MIDVIIKSTIIYWATALDLLVILALLFVRFDHKKYWQIIWGQIIGSTGLILISLFFAFILDFVPEQWILGFLGLIPIGLGLKYLLVGESEEEELEGTLAKRQNKKLLGTVILLSFASCGADNIGLFTPYFVTLQKGELSISLLTFLLNILLLGFLGQILSKIPHLHEFLESTSRWILAIVYIGLGLMVLLETGTIEKIFSFIS